jgi:hypothetical protein
MASLLPSAAGYLNPRFKDGAALAAASEYTASSLQMSNPAAVPVAGGTDQDPKGAITIRRAKTGQPVQLFLNSSRGSIETELRDMFSSYSQPLSVISDSLWRNGTLQVLYYCA